MRLDGVDGLRATAMTMVIAQHCSLLPFGWMGVWLFYTISGFFITQGFIRSADVRAPFGHRYAQFMGSRMLRIAPLYLLYIACNMPPLLLERGVHRLGDLLYLCTFTYNWQMIFDPWPGRSDWAPFGHLWTLSVENQFYLVFPLLTLLVPGRRQVLVMTVLACLGPVVRWAWLLWLDPAPNWGATLVSDGMVFGGLEYGVGLSSVCHFDAFLIGALIAHLQPRLAVSPRASNLLWTVALGATLAYVGGYVVLNYEAGARGYDVVRNVVSANPHGGYREVFVYVAMDLVAAAVLVHVLLRRAGTALLSSRLWAWVGRVSFGGYVFHVAVMMMASAELDRHFGGMNRAARQLCEFAITWSVTVALASASFTWFEQPIAQRWRQRRLHHRPQHVSAHSTVVVDT